MDKEIPGRLSGGGSTIPQKQPDICQGLMILLEERSGDGDIDMAELIQPSRHSLSSGLIKT